MVIKTAPIPRNQGLRAFRCSMGPWPVGIASQTRAGDPCYVWLRRCRAIGFPANSSKQHISMSRSTSNIAFILFLLVNATMILRPAELISALADLPIYEGFILGALALSLPAVKQHLSISALKQQPITLCVVGVLCAVAMSHASHMYLYGTRESSILFLKTMIYYILLVGLIDTPQRLRRLLAVIAVVSTIMISICVVDYLGMLDLRVVNHAAEFDGVNLAGEERSIERMNGTGLFSDPNDISLLIVATAILSLHFLTDTSRGERRFGWLVPIAIMAIALLCTRSRGGLLAAGAAGTILMMSRYGKKTAIVFAALGICAVAFIAGRQGSIDLSSGTGQDRIQLWRDGISALSSPAILFGIGQGMYEEIAGLVAHNSFVQAYVELGLFGGTLFFGCFFFAALALYRLNKTPREIGDPAMERLRPYMAALLAGWAAGLMSLSRCYVVPTYMIIGITAAYLNLVGISLRPPQLLVWWDKKHVIRLASGSMMLFAAFYVFVNVFAV